MIPEEYQWIIKQVQTRYEYLHLNFEQAEKVYLVDQDKNAHSETHFFSTWEEWDYEASSFKQILTPEQFKDYEEYMNRSIRDYEERMVEHDKEKARDIAYVNEQLTYYENELLPDLVDDRMIFTWPDLYQMQAKVDFLKAEYKMFLFKSKKELLVQHFRYCRLFSPNELQVALIRHRLAHLWPVYGLFKDAADDTTKAVIEHIKTKFRSYSDETEALMTRKIEELKAFREVCFKRHYGDQTRSAYYEIDEASPEKLREYQLMTILLLDKNKYGL